LFLVNGGNDGEVDRRGSYGAFILDCPRPINRVWRAGERESEQAREKEREREREREREGRRDGGQIEVYKLSFFPSSRSFFLA